MSDNFEQHLKKVKARKGSVWASSFDDEFEVFKIRTVAFEVRNAFAMSRKELASACGVTERQVVVFENPDAAMDENVAEKILEYFSFRVGQATKTKFTGSIDRLGAFVNCQRAAGMFSAPAEAQS